MAMQNLITNFFEAFFKKKKNYKKLIYKHFYQPIINNPPNFKNLFTGIKESLSASTPPLRSKCIQWQDIFS